MKKIFITTILLLLTLISLASNINKKITFAESTQYSNKAGLGMSINAVKSAYLDPSEIKNGSPIFNEEWLNENKALLVPEMINTSDTQSFSASSFESISESMALNYAMNSKITLSEKLFSENASFGFISTSSFSYNNYFCQYYYYMVSEFDSYAYYLPNYSSNLTMYRQNLHNDYINAIELLFSNNTYSKAEEFFDTYGTHVIGKAIYGGKAEIFYSVLSNKVDVGNENRLDITSLVDLTIDKIINNENDVSFNLQSILNTQYNYCNEKFRCKMTGGNHFSVLSFSSLNKYYNEWVNSIIGKESLVKTSSDGLIPLWELLPEQYNTTSNVNRMKNWFSKYASEYYTTNKNKYTCTFDPNLDQNYITIRNTVYRIDDSGRFKNKFDEIDLYSYLHYSLPIYVAYGYKKVSIDLQFDIREIDKGYSHVFIYSEKINNDKYCIASIKYEKQISSDFKTIEISFDDLNINSFLKENKIYIMYGASGKNEDDWENRNLKMRLRFSK